MIPKFVVIDSAANMPASVKSPYRHCAVIETDGEHMPSRIDRRSRACVRIVRVWDRCNVGRMVRSAFRRALDEADALDARLNAEHAQQRTSSEGDE